MDLGELLGGLDMGDAKKAISFIRDNRDDFDRLVRLAKELPDDALGLIGRLPSLLRSVGVWPRLASRPRRRRRPLSASRVMAARARPLPAARTR